MEMEEPFLDTSRVDTNQLAIRERPKRSTCEKLTSKASALLLSNESFCGIHSAKSVSTKSTVDFRLHLPHVHYSIQI